MAILQRLRRRGPAGEGANPEAVEADEVDDDARPDGDAAEPTDGADPDDLADPAADPDDPDTPDDRDEDPDGADDEPAASPTGGSARYRGRVGGFSLREWAPLALLQAMHPKQAIVTALGVAGVAMLSGRPARETLVVFFAVLVGQAVIGLHNDLVDWRRDQAHDTPGKPIADGRLSRANAWTALAIAALLLVPLVTTTGITAGFWYLGSVAVAMLGNVLFRTTLLSFWSWAVSFGMLPFYLSYGGWGGQAVGSPPEPAIVVLTGLLGIGVHFLRAVWGLVADHEDEWTYLPLKLGLKLGASRLLMVAVLYLVVIVVAMVVVGTQVGLSR